MAYMRYSIYAVARKNDEMMLSIYSTVDILYNILNTKRLNITVQLRIKRLFNTA